MEKTDVTQSIDHATAKVIEELHHRLEHHTDHCIEHLLRIHYPESLVNIDTAKIIHWPNEKNHLQEITTGHYLGLIPLGHQLRECSAAWKCVHSGWKLCHATIHRTLNTHQYELKLQLQASASQTQDNLYLALNDNSTDAHLLIQALLQGQKNEIANHKKSTVSWQGLGSSPEQLLWPRSQAHPWYSALLEDFLCHPQAGGIIKINFPKKSTEQEVLNLSLPLNFNHTLPKPWRDSHWLESILIINPIVVAPWVEKAIQSFVITPDQCNYSINIQNQTTIPNTSTHNTSIPNTSTLNTSTPNISGHPQKNNHISLLQIKQHSTHNTNTSIQAWVQCQYNNNSPHYQWRLFNPVKQAIRIFLTGIWTDAASTETPIHLPILHRRWHHLQNTITSTNSNIFDWKNWLRSHCTHHHDMLNVLLENCLNISCHAVSYEQTHKGRQFLSYGQQLRIKAKSSLRFYVSPNILLNIFANYFSAQQTQAQASQVVLSLINSNQEEIFQSPWTLHPWNIRTI